MILVTDFKVNIQLNMIGNPNYDTADICKDVKGQGQGPKNNQTDNLTDVGVCCCYLLEQRCSV